MYGSSFVLMAVVSQAESSKSRRKNLSPRPLVSAAVLTFQPAVTGILCSPAAWAAESATSAARESAAIRPSSDLATIVGRSRDMV